MFNSRFGFVCLALLGAAVASTAFAGDMEYTGPEGSSIDLTCNGDDRPAGSCEAADSSVTVDGGNLQSCEPNDGVNGSRGNDGELMEIYVYTECIAKPLPTAGYHIHYLAPPADEYDGVRVLQANGDEVDSLCFYESSPDIRMIRITMERVGLNAKVRLFDDFAVPQGGVVTVTLNAAEVSVSTWAQPGVPMASGAEVNQALVAALDASEEVDLEATGVGYVVITPAPGIHSLATRVSVRSSDLGLQHTGLGMGSYDDLTAPACAY